MKRVLLACALLLAPVVAWGKVLVVSPHDRIASGASTLRVDSQHAIVVGILQKYGADFTVVRPYGTKTLWCATGDQVFNGRVEHYDAVIHLNYRTGGGFELYNPDSLTQVAPVNMWPSVPQVFFHVPATSLSGGWNSSAGCSVGVHGHGSPIGTGRDSYSAYVIGKDWVWKSRNADMWGTRQLDSEAPPDSVPPGIFRPIVAVGVTQASRPRGTDGVGGDWCTSCDSVKHTANPKDSLLAWGRYRSPTDRAPLLYAVSGGGFQQNEGIIKILLAMADSASGGKVFDKPGYLPQKRALVLRRAFGRGTYANQATGTGGGITCWSADSCDTARVKVAIDSLKALKVKFTVGVNPDSADTYVYEQAWWRRATMAKFALESVSGSSAAGVAGVDATAGGGRCVDPFGHLRTRNILPPGATGLPDACGDANDTLSVFCNLVAGKKKIISLFGANRFDPSVIPINGDWSPLSMTNYGTSPGQDSVFWATRHAGFKTIAFGTAITQTNVNRHWAYTGPATGPSANNLTAPYGWGFETMRAPVKTAPGSGSSVLLGYLNLILMRAEQNALAQGWQNNGGHDNNAEGHFGDIVGRWYPEELPGYHHDFYTPTRAWAWTMSELGTADRAGGTPIAGMRAWWEIKWLVHQARAANSFMPAGKILDEFVYLSEVKP